MPTPAPPSGIIGVIFSSGRRVMFSKNRASSGCSSSCFSFMFVNSALPGTNMGRIYCFSRAGFSQLYSRRPTSHMSWSSRSSVPASFPVAFTSCGSVMGRRTFILSATSAISSVTTQASPQYSGSSAVTLWPIRSVIIWPSFRIFFLSSAMLIPLLSVLIWISVSYQKKQDTARGFRLSILKFCQSFCPKRRSKAALLLAICPFRHYNVCTFIYEPVPAFKIHPRTAFPGQRKPLPSFPVVEKKRITS
jgi:hypothetical protein